MTIAETASNFYGVAGIVFAVLGTIVVAVINNKSKENAKIKELEEKIDNLQTEFKSLRASFTLVCDEMERNETMTPQLKHFRKMFDL